MYVPLFHMLAMAYFEFLHFSHRIHHPWSDNTLTVFHINHQGSEVCTAAEEVVGSPHVG